MTAAPMNKQTEMLRLLDEGQVMVHLDPRREGVQVPGYLTEDPVLRLNIAYGFNLPALEIDDEGVYAVLSFGGRDFGCWLPWSSIFALTLPDYDHQGALWPDDMPKEMDPLFASVQHLKTGVEAPAPERAKGFAVIDGGASDEVVSEAAPDASDEPEPPDDSTTKGGPHLRLVKG